MIIMQNKPHKGISENMILAIIFLLIFAFLISVGLLKAGDVASSSSPMVAKYKAYYDCKNSGFSELGACIKSIFGGV